MRSTTSRPKLWTADDLAAFFGCAGILAFFLFFSC